ncbi:MAG: hypothetical protein P8X80_02260, partial [Desulfobacterales bacterium]
MQKQWRKTADDSIIFCCFLLKILFGQKPDHTGVPEFAVDIRIAAIEAFRTHSDAVFAAFIARFSIRVIRTVCQHYSLRSSDGSDYFKGWEYYYLSF